MFFDSVIKFTLIMEEEPEVGTSRWKDSEERIYLNDDENVEDIASPTRNSMSTQCDNDVPTKNQTATQRDTFTNTFQLSQKPEYKKDSYKLYHEMISNKANKMYKSAVEEYNRSSYETCISFLRKALVMKPNNVKYYVFRGDVYLQMCDFKSAILNYKRVCILEPKNKEFISKLAFIYFLQGQCYFDEEMYLDALECFTRAAELERNNKGYHSKSISCLAALKRHHECLDMINKRLEVEADNPDLFVLRARVHLLFSNSTLSYFDVKEALSLDPKNNEADLMQYNLEKKANYIKEKAVKLDLSGKTREAITKISHAIDTDPSATEYLVLRAGMHRRNMDFNASVDDLLLAMDKLNHDVNNELYLESQRQLMLTFNDCAVDCFNKGFYEEGIVLLEKAINSEKQDKALYMNRGDCFYKLGHIHYALLDYEQAQEMDADDKSINVRLSVVYNELGILEYKDRKYYRAEDYFSMAISLNLNVATFFISRARSRYMQEKTDEAKIDVISALYLDPVNKESFSMFARLFPGQTTDEILKSDLGMLVTEALMAEMKEDCKEIKRTDYVNKLSPLPNVITTSNYSVDMKKCMEDRQFHYSIIKGKKKVNDLVESVIQARQDLSCSATKVTSIKYAKNSSITTRKKCTNAVGLP